jgi:hypothetical protein
MLICHNGKIDQKPIKKKKLKWSRLEYTLYYEKDKDEFIRVSPPTYSDLIQQSKIVRP